MKKKKEYIGIDIFSGAGGLSLGAIWAGIKIPCAVEKDLSAAQTYKTNHPETNVFTQDIREIDPLSLGIKNLLLSLGDLHVKVFLFQTHRRVL